MLASLAASPSQLGFRFVLGSWKYHCTALTDTTHNQSNVVAGDKFTFYTAPMLNSTCVRGTLPRTSKKGNQPDLQQVNTYHHHIPGYFGIRSRSKPFICRPPTTYSSRGCMADCQVPVPPATTRGGCLTFVEPFHVVYCVI